MTALGEGDQVLATFLKGLELYQAAQLDRAAMQFQNSMQMAPTFAPSRLFLGASLAEGNRHKEAAGLLQSAVHRRRRTRRSRASPARSGSRPASRRSRSRRSSSRCSSRTPIARSKKLLGIAYVLGGRGGDAVTILSSYLETNPTDSRCPARRDLRHLYAAPQRPAGGDARGRSREPREVVEGVRRDEGPDAAARRAWVKHVQTS